LIDFAMAISPIELSCARLLLQRSGQPRGLGRATRGRWARACDVCGIIARSTLCARPRSAALHRHRRGLL